MHFPKHTPHDDRGPVSRVETEKGHHAIGNEFNLETDPLQVGLEEKQTSLSPSSAYFRLLGYANSWDWILRIVAALASLGGGTAYPLMTLILGNLVNDFNGAALGLLTPSKFRASVNHNTLCFVYLFLGTFGFLYMANLLFYSIAARMARRIRLAYLKKVL